MLSGYDLMGKRPELRKPKKDLTYTEAFRFFNLQPFGDADGDKVPNWTDCRPFDATRQGPIMDKIKRVTTGAPPESAVESRLNEQRKELERERMLQQQQQEIELETEPIPTVQTTLNVSGVPSSTTQTILDTEGPEAPETPMIDQVSEQVEQLPRRKELLEAEEELRNIPMENEYYLMVQYQDGRWENVGRNTISRLQQQAEELRQLPQIVRVEITEDAGLANALNRRQFLGETYDAFSGTYGKLKGKAGEYVEERGWKENVQKGLKTNPNVSSSERYAIRKRLDRYMTGTTPTKEMNEWLVNVGQSPEIRARKREMSGSGMYRPPSYDFREDLGGRNRPMRTMNSGFSWASSLKQPTSFAPKKNYWEVVREHTGMSRAGGYQQYNQQRKVPSGVQRYNPVTQQQSFLNRPNVKAPNQQGFEEIYQTEEEPFDSYQQQRYPEYQQQEIPQERGQVAQVSSFANKENRSRGLGITGGQRTLTGKNRGNR